MLFGRQQRCYNVDTTLKRRTAYWVRSDVSSFYVLAIFCDTFFITLLDNSRQTLFFLLDHFKPIIFGVFYFLFRIEIIASETSQFYSTPFHLLSSRFFLPNQVFHVQVVLSLKISR